jgi:hypothetical protein
VCDVLPLVLKWDTRVKLSADQLYSWLQLAIEFYICHITQPADKGSAGQYIFFLSVSSIQFNSFNSLQFNEIQIYDK